MPNLERMPALPLIANDPFFSVWLPGDKFTDCDPTHWSEQPMRLDGEITVDSVKYKWLSHGGRAAETTKLTVTATKTSSVFIAGPVELTATFWTPALPDDLDILSTPITCLDLSVRSLDKAKHNVSVIFKAPEELCFEGRAMPDLYRDIMDYGSFKVGVTGQKVQKVLGGSGDRITIDWGYLYVASSFVDQNNRIKWNTEAGDTPSSTFVLLGYDDIASINYFGTPCKAWYARNGATIIDALLSFYENHDALLKKCDKLDRRVKQDALKAGGKSYLKIVNAAWRHTFAAHKLIATPKGEMAFLSKENDSNGCIGTVDVSYPSIPLFLKYCPELVNALCRPVLEFAQMRVWPFDFAPHDVGRYPDCTGQRYACKKEFKIGQSICPMYLYPASYDLYDFDKQMPVEESGNMLCMLYTAVRYGADDGLAKTYLPTLSKWVKYLDRYGEDPENQLCTDDFAGHLAHNVNLSAKAIMGTMCYAKLLVHFGDKDNAARWEKRARDMMDSWYSRVTKTECTPLTFDGQGWSMKYNLVWDTVLGFDLLPQSFYEKEIASYLPRINRYGLPLDSRADYTKSDWICWCAAMTKDMDKRTKMLEPIARYLSETPSRVAFSDWYDTKSGRYQAFIARSVQGGVFMPMLSDAE